MAAVFAYKGFNAAEVPTEPKKLRQFEKLRGRMTKTVFGRRWSSNNPHTGNNQAAKLERRAIKDLRAAERNYPGWCGYAESGASR